MEKSDWKKEWKAFYQPSVGKFSVVDVPGWNFLMVDGEGDPNVAPAYASAIEALYAVSYTLKFACKKGPLAVDYSVFPLEGLWWVDEGRDFCQCSKAEWKWTAMIAQPECITAAMVQAAREEVVRKKKLDLSLLRFERFVEGESMQTLYIGPYRDEKETIAAMHRSIASAGKRLRGKHHEIYLSDPRRTAPEKLKTILRQPVE